VYATASASPFPSAVRKEELARGAIDMLKKAQAAGFFKDPKHVERVKADDNLDAIRQRADFKEWIADLETNKLAQ
jgi:hypothetical protein